MNILALETSCDDTSIALIHGEDETITLTSQVHASQIDLHAVYGGIVPEIAARAHTEVIPLLLKQIYDPHNPPDAIAVTSGPGLITSLIVGVETAKTIAAIQHIPLVRVNHIEGHIYANWIHARSAITFPALALIVSGGHTELLFMKHHLEYQKIGATVDDAAGEAFDKVGKLLGLAYPGGPKISKLAEMGDPRAIQLPRPMIDSNDFQFSFSGLKTAARYYIEKHKELLDEKNVRERADFCAGFETAIIDVLAHKTYKAVLAYQPKTILLGGGVAANKKLRERFTSIIQEKTESTIILPEINLCMDNAAMIGSAGYFKARANQFSIWNEVVADPNWEL